MSLLCRLNVALLSICVAVVYSGTVSYYATQININVSDSIDMPFWGEISKKSSKPMESVVFCQILSYFKGCITEYRQILCNPTEKRVNLVKSA